MLPTKDVDMSSPLGRDLLSYAISICGMSRLVSDGLLRPQVKLRWISKENTYDIR